MKVRLCVVPIIGVLFGSLILNKTYSQRVAVATTRAVSSPAIDAKPPSVVPSETRSDPTGPTSTQAPVALVLEPYRALSVEVLVTAPRTPRVLVIGDSVALQICKAMPEAECFAKEGRWTKDNVGKNAILEAIKKADIQKGDLVVTHACCSFPDDDMEEKTIEYFSLLKELTDHHVVLYPGDQAICFQPLTEAMIKNLGTSNREPACEMMSRVRRIQQVLISNSLKSFTLKGPYIEDGIHLQPTAVGEVIEWIRMVE